MLDDVQAVVNPAPMHALVMLIPMFLVPGRSAPHVDAVGPVFYAFAGSAPLTAL
jgi:hypothetical protein